VITWKTKAQPGIGSPSLRGLVRPERPEWSMRRVVDRLAGLRRAAEVKPQESLIVLDGPFHEVFGMLDGCGRLHGPP
jgi:hypothetical protein